MEADILKALQSIQFQLVLITALLSVRVGIAFYRS